MEGQRRRINFTLTCKRVRRTLRCECRCGGDIRDGGSGSFARGDHELVSLALGKQSNNENILFPRVTRQVPESKTASFGLGQQTQKHHKGGRMANTACIQPGGGEVFDWVVVMFVLW